jgi:hypothetical protein
MNTFLLVLTLCGTLNSSSFTCERYVIDHTLTKEDCLKSIVSVYNQEPSPLYDVMGDLGHNWQLIKSTKIQCVAENKE